MRTDIRTAALAMACLSVAACSSESGSSITPGTSPSVVGGTGAGIMEGNLLVTVAVNQAARDIVSKLDLVKDTKGRIILLPGNVGLDVSAWKTFHGRVETLVQRFKNDRDTSTSDASSAYHTQTFAFIPPSVIVDAVNGMSAILARFGTNISLSGAQIQPPDSMLAMSICGEVIKKFTYTCIIPTPSMAVQGQGAIAKDMDRLTTQVALATDFVTKHKDDSSDFTKSQINALKSDIADAMTLANWLYGPANPAPAAPAAPALPGSSGTMPAPTSPSPAPVSATVTSNYAAVAVASALDSELIENTKILGTQIGGAGAGFYAASNLWNTLGNVPYYASGGVSASYAFYAYDGNKLVMKAAGVLGAVTPYHSIKNVRRSVTLDKGTYKEEKKNGAPLNCDDKRSGAADQFCAQ